VAVLGSGTEAWEPRAAPLGRWLAGRGVHLLTGGGGGVMAAVARAFTACPPPRGLSVGVLPASADDPAHPPPGYPSPWIELPLATHLPARGAAGTRPDSRNHVNVLSADALVALPGGDGTASELALALRYRRPAVAWLERPAELPGRPAAIPMARDLDAVVAFVEEALRRAARPPRP
jgi:predicted Rossmann-fold nucleotide-binding protein